MSWQPIETAPLDGSWILAFGSNHRSGATMMVLQGVPGFQDGNDWLSSDDGYGAYLTPTHWMPLPDPPQEKK